MVFPANAPAAWDRVYVRGWWTEIAREVREESNVGLPGATLTARLLVDSVTYRDTPAGAPTVVDTSSGFGAQVRASDGLAVLLVPVGDDPQITPHGGAAGDPILTRIFDPVLGEYDVFISASTPVLNRPGDALHGQRVFELGQVSYDPPSKRYYMRVAGPAGPASTHAAQHAPGGSDSLGATYAALSGDQTVAGVKTFSSPPVVPVGSAAGNPVRRDDARLGDSRTPTSHASSHAPGGTDPVTGYVPSSGDSTVAGVKTFSSPPVVPVGSANGHPVRRDDARLGNARTPTAHASSHQPGGSDQLAGLAISQVDGLATALAALPKGTVRRGRKSSSAAQTTTTTQGSATKLIQLDVPVTAGRTYRVVGACPVYSSAAGNAILQITYTTDGSTPTPSSTRLTYSVAPTPSGAVAVEATTEDTLVPATSGTIKVLLSIYAATAGTYTPQGSADWAIRFRVEDVGLDSGSTGATIF